MKKTLLVIVLAMASTFPVAAQMSYSPSVFTMGPEIRTNGLGLAASVELTENKKNSTALSFGLYTLHHAKEVKVKNEQIFNPRPYVYGKTNRAFTFHTSYNYQHKFGVANRLAPSMFTGVELGLNSAFLRPVYLIITGSETEPPSIRKYDPSVHTDQSKIMGDGGWSKGFNELSPELGLHAAIYLQMDWDQDYVLKRLKTGISADYFFRDLNIMYGNQNQLFGSLFVSYQLGKNH